MDFLELSQEDEMDLIHYVQKTENENMNINLFGKEHKFSTIAKFTTGSAILVFNFLNS